jgi:hypothetical protein
MMVVVVVDIKLVSNTAYCSTNHFKRVILQSRWYVQIDLVGLDLLVELVELNTSRTSQLLMAVKQKVFDLNC